MADKDMEEKKEKIEVEAEAEAEDMRAEVTSDIERMQAAVDQLTNAGSDLFAQQIKELETKIKLEKEKAAVIAAAAQSEAEKEVKIVKDKVTMSYGLKAWEICKMIALVAIIYGLFGR